MNQREHYEQSAFVRLARYTPGGAHHMLLAIPNGGHRDVRVARKLKAEGVRPGVPDLFLARPVGGYAGLWIEMKADGGRLRDNQREFMDALVDIGYACAVAYGAQSAHTAYTDYLHGHYPGGLCVYQDGRFARRLET